MKEMFAHSQSETELMNTSALRKAFVADDITTPGELKLVYTHYDRLIVGTAVPLDQILELPNPSNLRADYFLQRREIGIINVGGKATVTVDNESFDLNKLDALYIGKGKKQVRFSSADANDNAVLYLLSAPAHTSHPTRVCTRSEAQPLQLGALQSSNARTVYKYIHQDGIQSCQLVMGLTLLETGSVWNSVPPHTHTRRSEIYFYFDVAPEQRIFHFMGEPTQTRHVVLSNQQAVVSPPWSMHFGCGTGSYGFIWGMAGENLDYTDMDAAPVHSLL